MALSLFATASADEKRLHNFGAVAISPDGSRVVAIESDDAVIEGSPTRQDLVIRPVDGSAPHVVALPCAPDPDCVPSSPTWSPDGTKFVFVLRSPKNKMRALYSADPDGRTLVKLLDFEGTLGAPRFSPSGQLAVLATAAAKKEIGATQAGAPIVGEIGRDNDEQRIAIVADGKISWSSPADTFVYEYDWKPDGRGFVGTAAPGNGDDNYWVAKLYAFDARSARATLLYSPANPQQQLAHPLASPDGKYVAFIAGLMSDFGSTGGEIYVVPAQGGPARDVTPGIAATATTFAWACARDADRDRIDFSALQSGERQIRSVGASGTQPERLVHSSGFSSASFPSRSCDANGHTATVVQTFQKPPEIYIGTGDTLAQLTHANAGIGAETAARSTTWTNDGKTVQGWLLAPLHVDATRRHPMIVYIHGGPAAATEPSFVGRGTLRELLRAGYYIFAPNPRGSFGEGEAFTLGNVKDFGYGDLRDDLAGVDAVERIAPIDDSRLGITGGSYGGFMTMWAVTQTDRFKAAVGGAGISNWISYYGENGIDQWMIPYFGASAYDDPAPYRRSSPIDFIKNVKTPTFAYVGERDVECPAPQSLEFWHALETLGVPTQLVIYDGEGHGIRTPAHRADVTKRTLAWFARYLKP